MCLNRGHVTSLSLWTALPRLFISTKREGVLLVSNPSTLAWARPLPPARAINTGRTAPLTHRTGFACAWPSHSVCRTPTQRCCLLTSAWAARLPCITRSPPLLPPVGAFAEYNTHAHIESGLPAGTVAQRFGRDLLVVVLHLLSNPSRCREVGASWTDVAVTLVAGIGGPAAEMSGLVDCPLTLGSWHVWWHSWVVIRGLHQHLPLRVQSVPVVGGVNALVDTAM